MQEFGVQRCFKTLICTVFFKLTEASKPSDDANWIILVSKIYAIYLKWNLMFLNEVMISVFNKQPEIQC